MIIGFKINFCESYFWGKSPWLVRNTETPFSHPNLIKHLLAPVKDVNNQKDRNERHRWHVVPQSGRRIAFFYLYLHIHLLNYVTVLIPHIWKTCDYLANSVLFLPWW